MIISRAAAGYLSLAIVASLPVPAGAQQPTQYICVPDYAIGFAVKANGTWEPTTFTTPEKYIIRRLKPGERTIYWTTGEVMPTWVVSQIGDNIALAACKDMGPSSMGTLESELVCRGVVDVSFSSKTLRFELVRTGNYVRPANPESSGDNPAMSIGKCSAF
jgi:hypothetical protein